MGPACLLSAILLLMAASALHIQKHLDAASFLSALKSQQTSLTNQILSLQNDITNTLNSVNYVSDPASKIKMLEEAVMRQKKQINEISLELVTPVQEMSWTCPNLMGTNQQELINLSSDISTSTNSLYNQFNNYSGSNVTSNTVTNAQAASQYSKQIHDTLNYNINFVDPSEFQTILQTNLAADNWTGGNMTVQQVNQLYMQQANQADAVHICPTQIPYSDGTNCINCQNNMYFDISKKQCVNCQSFNPQTHYCQQTPIQIIYNSPNFQASKDRLILSPNTTLDEVNAIFDGATHVCPTDKPFLVNGNCINCVSPNTLFDFENKQCTQCPQSSVYEPAKYQCVSTAPATYITNYGNGANNIIIPQGTTLNQLQQQQQGPNTQACPVDKPFFNGNQCIDCPSGQLFSVQERACTQCPSQTVFNATTHYCQGISRAYYSNLGNNNWTSSDPQKTRSDIATAASDNSATSCPLQSPFFNNNSCISCQENQYFSFDTLQCKYCPSNTIYSPSMHQCVNSVAGNYQTNPQTADNLIYGGISKNQWITRYYQNQQQNPNIADCPKEQPYFDGVVCMECPDQYPYFNLNYKRCQTCSQDSQYDEAAHECLSAEGNILDQSPNLQKMAAGIFA